MNVDISSIAADNHRYAIHLATFQNVIIYKKDSYNIADISLNREPFEVVDFWRNISLSAEILLKACLLKHHTPLFKKRAHSEYGEKVTAVANKWLDETLRKLEINYVAQINTGTVNTALKLAEKELFASLSIDAEKTQLITEMFYIIIRTRRNRNSHFFFPNQGHIDITEIEILFLPLLNLLEEIYRL